MTSPRQRGVAARIRFPRSTIRALIGCVALLVGVTAVTSPAAAALSFVNRTTADGLTDNDVYGVFADGANVYAATNSGLGISTDGGETFVSRTTTNGLADNQVYGVFADGTTVYAATASALSISTDSGATFTTSGLASWTFGVFAVGSTVYAASLSGLHISTNGGTSFTNRTTTDGLGANQVNGVFVDGSTVYAATPGGLSISTDGGTSFTNRTTTHGLGNDTVRAVVADGATVYAATAGGLSISTNGGTSFTNYTTANGLGSNNLYSVFVDGSTVYAGTTSGLSIGTDSGSGSTSAAPTATYDFTFNTSSGGECFTWTVPRGPVILPTSQVACTPEGTELVGWSVPGQSTNFSDGGTVIASADQTFTAVAKNPWVRVTYDANVGDDTACLIDGENTTDRQVTVLTGREGTLAKEAPCTPAGYVLAGWTDRPTTGGPTRAVDGSVMRAVGDTMAAIWSADPNPANDIHLYAVWALR